LTPEEAHVLYGLTAPTNVDATNEPTDDEEEDLFGLNRDDFKPRNT
jgi:hypothetical protein